MMQASTAKHWLQLLALLHIIVGLSLPFLAGTFLFDYYHAQLLEAFHTKDEAARQMGIFMVGILGPTIASWGLLFLFIVGYAYKERSYRAWLYMVIAVIGWSLADMGYSLLYGVMLNILIDLVVMSLLLIPLLASRSHFRREQGSDDL